MEQETNKQKSILELIVELAQAIPSVILGKPIHNYCKDIFHSSRPIQPVHSVIYPVIFKDKQFSLRELNKKLYSLVPPTARKKGSVEVIRFRYGEENVSNDRDYVFMSTVVCPGYVQISEPIIDATREIITEMKLKDNSLSKKLGFEEGKKRIFETSQFNPSREIYLVPYISEKHFEKMRRSSETGHPFIGRQEIRMNDWNSYQR